MVGGLPFAGTIRERGSLGRINKRICREKSINAFSSFPEDPSDSEAQPDVHAGWH